MRTANQTKFILINKQADSLYALVADGEYTATTLGPDRWKSLIGSEASLQKKCKREGFNVKCTNAFKARVGILGNNEDHCDSCDSQIGFGLNLDSPCGNFQRGSSPQNIKAMGYILVQ